MFDFVILRVTGISTTGVSTATGSTDMEVCVLVVGNICIIFLTHYLKEDK